MSMHNKIADKGKLHLFLYFYYGQVESFSFRACGRMFHCFPLIFVNSVPKIEQGKKKNQLSMYMF